MITTSCRFASAHEAASFHSKRTAKYTMMPTTTNSNAIRPLCSSSWPTCGPTNSTRRNCTSAFWACRADSTVRLWAAVSSFGRTGRRIITSCEVPKFCTWKSE